MVRLQHTGAIRWTCCAPKCHLFKQQSGGCCRLVVTVGANGSYWLSLIPFFFIRAQPMLLTSVLFFCIFILLIWFNFAFASLKQNNIKRFIFLIISVCGCVCLSTGDQRSQMHRLSWGWVPGTCKLPSRVLGIELWSPQKPYVFLTSESSLQSLLWWPFVWFTVSFWDGVSLCSPRCPERTL